MRVYVAGAMRGHPDLNFAAFHNAEAQLEAAGHVVFNPARLPKGLSLGEYMAIDLQWICSKADAIAMLPGWEQSEGACIEFNLALMLGLEVITL